MYLSRLIFFTVLLIPVPSFARTICGLMSVGLHCSSSWNDATVLSGPSKNLMMQIDEATCNQLIQAGVQYYCVNAERIHQCFPGGTICGSPWVATSQFAYDEARSVQENARADAEDKRWCAAHRNGTGICVR